MRATRTRFRHHILSLTVAGLVLANGCSKNEGTEACFDTSKPQEVRYASCVQQCEKNKAACTLAEDLRSAGKQSALAGAQPTTPPPAQTAAAAIAPEEPKPSAASGGSVKTISAADMKKLAASAKRSITADDAAQLRQLTHPTGKGGTLGAVRMTQTDDEILLDIPVTWQGGLTTKSYDTVYTWRLNNKGGSDLTIGSDTAVIKIDEVHRAAADNFLKSRRSQITP